MVPATKDLSKAWETFHQELVLSRENCFISLAGLLDGIGKDLKGRQLQSEHQFRQLTATDHQVGVDGIAAEPIAPFLASLAPKKVHLRKWLELFSESIERTSE